MKKFVLSKKYWFLGAIALSAVGGYVYFAFSHKGLPSDIEIGVVQKGEVVEVVSETGSVKAAQAVDLAFDSGGKVAYAVAEGSKAAEGDTLVQLDASEQAANLASAKARLNAEQIRLDALYAGEDTASLAVTQSSVDAAQTSLQNAKSNLTDVTAQQDQLLANAKNTLRSSDLQAYLADGEGRESDDSYAAPAVTGTYTSDKEGAYELELYASAGPFGSSYRVSGLENDTEPVSTVSPTPVGSHGLFIKFPINFAKHVKWVIPVPNTHSSYYLANLNAYNAVADARTVAIANAQNAIASAQSALIGVQSQLALASGPARNELIDAQKALVTQMQAAVDSAQIAVDNSAIKAPFSGTVTKVRPSVGETVAPSAPVASLISDGDYQLTVNVSEVDIAEMSIGDQAVVTFDAYDGISFKAHVITIAPNAELVEGVKVFAVTLAFDSQDQRIKDGLSANIDITTAQHENVIAIPTRAIYEDRDGKFVRVVTDNTNISEARITTGLRGSNGKTEVLSGLLGGESIVTFANEASIARIEKK